MPPITFLGEYRVETIQVKNRLKKKDFPVFSFNTLYKNLKYQNQFLGFDLISYIHLLRNVYFFFLISACF